jgi:hypothetical protein
MKQLFVAAFLLATATSLVRSQEPIRERFEWADIWVTDADKSDLPRVLLIGDSITRGYFDGVEKQLAGKAYRTIWGRLPRPPNGSKRGTGSPPSLYVTGAT